MIETRGGTCSTNCKHVGRFLALPNTVNVSAAFFGPAENRKRTGRFLGGHRKRPTHRPFPVGVGPAGRLLDVRGYVWPKIRPAVVYGRHVRGFPTPLPGTAGTLAVWGGAGSDGRYVGRLRWSQIWRPLRWPFVLQPDPAAGTLAVFG